MAWSYSYHPRSIDYFYDKWRFAWYRDCSISQVKSLSAGTIRLFLEVTTSEFGVYNRYTGAYDSGYVYTTSGDTISCDGETITIVAPFVVTRDNASYSGYVDVPNSWAGKTVTLEIADDTTGESVTLGASMTFTLTTNAGAGSTINVNRAASNVGTTGNIASGAIIYNGDALTINFVPDSNYEVLVHTVNGATFTSGNTYTVSSDVSVISTARLLASDVGATDANIGATSTITITRYGDYIHSLQYSFGSLSGYITANGSLSATEVKFSSTSVAFTVPTSFYNEIPNASSGVCTITCRTYENASSSQTLGNPKSCTFIASVSPATSSPTVAGTVVDTNTATAALTNDSSRLVRYLSSALCTITATAKNGANIVSKTINGQAVDSNDQITISGDDLNTGSFRFTATDSRGLSTTTNVSLILIPYVKLTCNPEFSRNTPTDGNVNLTFNGKMYTGEWRSGVNNRLTIRFRYRVNDPNENYSSWVDISSQYTMQSSSYFSGQGTSQSAIALARPSGENGYDYRNAYRFQIEVTDGDGTNVCSTVTREFVVQQGIPVFDWGKNDFRFNVPIKIGNTELTGAQLQSLLALLS